MCNLFPFQEVDVEEEDFIIDQLYLHEEFNLAGDFNHNIALIRIKPKGGRGIRFGTYVQPVCLPQLDAQCLAGMNGSIAGWNSRREPGPGMTRLEQDFGNISFNNHIYWP